MTRPRPTHHQGDVITTTSPSAHFKSALEEGVPSKSAASVTGAVTRNSMSALDRLDAALISLAGDNRQTPCMGKRRARWTSDDHGDREWAAWHCISLACPVLSLCGEAGDELKASAGVWGGVPRGTSAAAGRPKTNRTTNQKAS